MKMFRMMVCGIAVAVLACALSGCTGDGARSAPSSQQGVAEVLQQQAQEYAGDTQGADESPADSSDSSFAGGGVASYAEDAIDIDLTKMGSEMVYASVFDMLSNSAEYDGKVVRMSGPFYHTRDEGAKADYYFVIITDALECCAQGLEFVWDDGSHVFPDDYPAEGSEVVVTGVFEPYKEGTFTYVHLVNATLEMV